MFCGLFSRPPPGAVYLIKKRKDVYALEYKLDDAFTVPVDTIIAKTDSVKREVYVKISARLRGRGYELPFIHTNDVNTLVDDFWAAVSICDGKHNKW
jgi:hypothetical protein